MEAINEKSGGENPRGCLELPLTLFLSSRGEVKPVANRRPGGSGGRIGYPVSRKLKLGTNCMRYCMWQSESVGIPPGVRSQEMSFKGNRREPGKTIGLVNDTRRTHTGLSEECGGNTSASNGLCVGAAWLSPSLPWKLKCHNEAQPFIPLTGYAGDSVGDCHRRCVREGGDDWLSLAAPRPGSTHVL